MRPSRATLLALLLAQVACGDGGSGGTEPDPPGPGVASVVISPRGLILPVGGGAQLSAAARNAAGAEITGASISWSSRDASIASISNRGEVAGNRVGQTQVIAAAQGRADTVNVAVIDNFTLEVMPPAATVDIGGTVQFTVRARDGAGNPVAAPPVSWASSVPTRATISNTGLALGVTAGTTNITASAGQRTSPPAVLTVRDTTTAAACDGIAAVDRFDASIDYGFKAVGIIDDNGYTYDADDTGRLEAVMTRDLATPFTAAWSGPISGNASVTQRRSSGSSVITLSGGGQIIAQGPFGLPHMTLIVDLAKCTFWIRGAAVIQTRLVQNNSTTDGPEQVAQVQFSGPLGGWQVLGILVPTGSLPAHSLVWSTLNTDDALMPLGIVTGLFQHSGDEPAVGQASGGLVMFRR